MSVHWLGRPAGELVGKGGDGLVGETSGYLINEMDKRAAGTAVERIHVAAAGTLTDVVVVVVRYRPNLCIGLLLHHLGEIGTEGVQHLWIGKAKLPITHPPAPCFGEPLRVAVEILLWGNQFLKSVHIHAFCPTEWA